MHTEKPQQASAETSCRPILPPFRFFDLPAELRNLVYEHITDQCKGIPILHRGRLGDRSGLLDINDRLRDEYQHVYLLRAGKIWLEVVSFDFRHVVTFINQLSDGELSALSTLSHCKESKICIKLNFTRLPELERDTGLLNRWLNRVGQATKKGSMLDMEYSLGSLAPMVSTRTPVHVYRRESVLTRLRALSSPSEKFATNDRAREAVRKIRRQLYIIY